MIQMSVRKQYRVECAIRSCRWPVQRLGFFAALKQTAINHDPRLLCLDDVTGPGYFAASCANEGDFHLDGIFVVMKALSFSPAPGASVRSGNWLSGFAAMDRRRASPVRRRFRFRAPSAQSIRA